MKTITLRPSVFFPVRTCVRAFLAVLFLPALIGANPLYAGMGLDVLTWSEAGVLDDRVHGSLDSPIGATLLIGYRFNGYFSLELFGYQSLPAYLKESGTDYLQHYMIGLGPRINVLNFRHSSWTPWFSWYATYQFIDRNRPPDCCEDSPALIDTLMKGAGRSATVGVDIKLKEDTVLQVAVRESTVWANWEDPGMADGETTSEEIFVVVHFSPGAGE